MHESVRQMLGQLKTNLGNIEDCLSQVDLSDEDFYELASLGPGHTRAMESQLFFWKVKLEQIVQYVEHGLDSGRTDASYMVDLMRTFTAMTTHALNEKTHGPYKEYPATVGALSDQGEIVRSKAKSANESGKDKRKARDDFIARRDAELELANFKGHRARRISAELMANGVPYSSEKTVARILAKMRKTAADNYV